MQYNKYQPSKQVVKLYFTILLRINLINIKNMGSLIKSIKLRKKKNKTKKKKGKTKRLKKKSKEETVYHNYLQLGAKIFKCMQANPKDLKKKFQSLLNYGE